MGRIYVVATPIGNLSDISERVLKTLSEVKLIAAEDTRRTLKLLNYFDIKTSVVSNYKYNELERGKDLIEQVIRDDIDIAVVSDAGTPCISDPGSVLVEMARNRGIEVIAIPGPSAVITALSASGFNFIKFGFMGFIPRDKKEQEKYIGELINLSIDTLVLFESPNRIIKSLKMIETSLPDCRLFVVNDLTKYYERSYWGNISEVIQKLEEEEKSGLGEYTIVLHKEPALSISEEAETLSAEAQLVDEIVKTGCTLKDAVSRVSERTQMSKKDVYKASLNLKEISY